nr:glycoside hydrolase family 99-like domain-containing protein [uncultured Tateyamaria sp.]
MPTDGERYVKELKGTIELEHLHRYQLARYIAKDLDVLDIACGEGYGSDIIAASAKSVIGVDINAHAIEHASFYYRDPRIFFRAGSATDIPVQDASVDMVVSFETIEHLEDHERMMQELRRVLRPGGILLISSPNKLEYSDKSGYNNPFHVKELYTEEFASLVGSHFKNCAHYGQRLSAASLIASEDKTEFLTFSGSGYRTGVLNARYDLILASDGALPTLPNSGYEIHDSPLEPYAAEHARCEATQVQQNFDELEISHRELSSLHQAKEDTVLQLTCRLKTVNALATEIVQSKWWRRTKTLRRWSNSIRKWRGRSKKVWPTELDFVTDLGVSGLPTPGASQRSASGTAPDNVACDIPVVRYSDIDEKYVPYTTHEEIQTVVKAIAFYLPQFHPFPENDQWWGKGFTEWTNVGKAKPLFDGHYQPHCPIHLGYYDLRMREVMEEQARLARNYGLSGFAYYFYWFAGKRLMDVPLENMLANKDVDLPFCMIWANENWSRKWDGQENDVLIAQDHSMEDSKALLEYLRKFFEDERYIKINGRPLFVIYNPNIIPQMKKTLAMWREEAKKFGFPDLYLVSAQTFGHKNPGDFGFDAAMEFPPHTIESREISGQMCNLKTGFSGRIYDYDHVVQNAVKRPNKGYKVFPSSMLSWDNTARKNLNSHVFAKFSLTRYAQWLSSNLERVAKDNVLDDDERLVFINAWNEWAEGTHLEPDQQHGYGYLEATQRTLLNFDERARRFLRPEVPRATEARYAVVAHVYYEDTWPELSAFIASFSGVKIDVYVTTTSLKIADMIAESMPEAVVELVDNRGRDIRPFLISLRRILHLNYRAVCKVHGKKSVYRSDGDAMRKSTLASLAAPEAIERFEMDDKLGLIAASKSVVPHTGKNMTYDKEITEELCREIGHEFRYNRFVAGSMFWVKPRAISSLLKLQVTEFEVESGLADGTLAHSVERVIVNVVEDTGYEVSDI